KPALEKGLFAGEELVPEELTQVRMGKIIQEKFPNLDDEDREAVRQHAIAALNFVQQAKKAINDGDTSGSGQSGGESTNTSLIDGVRKFALDMRELDIDLIDRINPFGEAYAILSKAMTADRLEQLKAIIAAKRATLSLDEARDLAKRALIFKKEKNRLPSITAMDPWEKRMAEGIAFLQRKAREEANG
ncbi:MAG: DEAD/DEAH box helicase, partial [Akkermansiaceae bacterium]